MSFFTSHSFTSVTNTNQKLITHHGFHHVPERDVTYIVLSVYLLTLIHRLPMKRKQHKYATELELDFREYTVRCRADCGSLLGALYTIYQVTSYLRHLRLLALSIVTCSPNMSFLDPLISDNSRGLEKFELGHYPPSHL